MEVGCDLDGVICNWLSAVRKHLDINEGDDPWLWNVWECWGISEDDFRRACNEAYEQHLFFRAAAYPGAIEALHELHSLGHSIHIVTARSHPVGRRDTIAWLEEHDVRYKSLTFASDKSCYPADVFIEDNVYNAEALMARGVKAFLMDRPWNQEDTEVPRVLTMNDFVAEVQHMESQKLARQEGNPRPFRTFETGATRDLDESKLDYEGFLSPAVLKRFAEYMHKNRVMADGSLRSSDNWQAGMPNESYVKSGWRHWQDVWSNHRGLDTGVDQEEALCAVMFNAMGYLYNILQDKDEKDA